MIHGHLFPWFLQAPAAPVVHPIRAKAMPRETTRLLVSTPKAGSPCWAFSIQHFHFVFCLQQNCNCTMNSRFLGSAFVRPEQNQLWQRHPQQLPQSHRRTHHNMASLMLKIFEAAWSPTSHQACSQAPCPWRRSHRLWKLSASFGIGTSTSMASPTRILRTWDCFSI